MRLHELQFIQLSVVRPSEEKSEGLLTRVSTRNSDVKQIVRDVFVDGKFANEHLSGRGGGTEHGEINTWKPGVTHLNTGQRLNTLSGLI